MVTGAVGDGVWVSPLPLFGYLWKMLLRARGIYSTQADVGLLIHHPLPEEPVPLNVPAHSSGCVLCTDPSRDPTGQPSP